MRGSLLLTGLRHGRGDDLGDDQLLRRPELPHGLVLGHGLRGHRGLSLVLGLRCARHLLSGQFARLWVRKASFWEDFGGGFMHFGWLEALRCGPKHPKTVLRMRSGAHNEGARKARSRFS